MNSLNDLLTGKLKGATKIKLSCGLKEVPEEVYALYDTLEYLDLSGNFITTLPEEFSVLKKLKILFFSDNHFIEFPKILGQCLELEMIGFKANKISHIPENAFPPKLRWLILTNNKIKTLPQSIGNCARMQKLMLAGNCLEELPVEMAKLGNLQLLRISANNLREIPHWLFSLPVLSWLAYAGNPCNKVRTGSVPFRQIYWENLVVKEQLGQGTSGVIMKAQWVNQDLNVDETQRNDVAVKIYKGEVTSDGLPLDEMNAALEAGIHKNLVQILGKIQEHPEGKQGLVMGLIPGEYKNLGGPPDFDTCTRDVFLSGTQFSLQQVLVIASGIASAMEHLHAHDIMHGDLYAHNILVGPDGFPLFGDFGAATMYQSENKVTKEAIECIEVRAYGCLLEDLLNHLVRDYDNTGCIGLLVELKDECMDTLMSKRPLFKNITERISSLKQNRVIAL